MKIIVIELPVTVLSFGCLYLGILGFKSIFARLHTVINLRVVSVDTAHLVYFCALACSEVFQKRPGN